MKNNKAHNGATGVSSTNNAATIGSTCWKTNKWTNKNNWGTDLTFYIKINSEGITDLNVNCKAIKLLEDNMEEKLSNSANGNDFLDKISKAQFMQGINDK